MVDTGTARVSDRVAGSGQSRDEETSARLLDEVLRGYEPGRSDAGSAQKLSQEQVEKLCTVAKSKADPNFQARAIEGLYKLAMQEKSQEGKTWLIGKLGTLVKDIQDEKQKPAKEKTGSLPDSLPGIKPTYGTYGVLPELSIGERPRTVDSLIGGSEYKKPDPIQRVADKILKDKETPLEVKKAVIGATSETARDLIALSVDHSTEIRIACLKQGVKADIADTLAKCGEIKELRIAAIKTGQMQPENLAWTIGDTKEPEDLRIAAIEAATDKTACGKVITAIVQDRGSSPALLAAALKSPCLDRDKIAKDERLPYQLRMDVVKERPGSTASSCEFLRRQDLSTEDKDFYLQKIMQLASPSKEGILRDIASDRSIDLRYREQAAAQPGVLQACDLALTAEEMIAAGSKPELINKCVDLLTKMDGKNIKAEILQYMQEEIVKGELPLKELIEWQQKWPLVPSLAMQLRDMGIHSDFSDAQLKDFAERLESKMSGSEIEKLLSNMLAYNNASPQLQELLRSNLDAALLFRATDAQLGKPGAKADQLDMSKLLDSVADGKPIDSFIGKVDKKLSDLMQLSYDFLKRDQEKIAEYATKVEDSKSAIVSITSTKLNSEDDNRKQTQAKVIANLSSYERKLDEGIADAKRHTESLQAVLAPFISAQHRMLLASGQKDQAALLAVAAVSQLKDAPKYLLDQIKDRAGTDETTKLFLGGGPAVPTTAAQAISALSNLKGRTDYDEYGVRSSAPGQELEWLAVMASTEIVPSQVRAEVIDARRYQAIRAILTDGLGDQNNPNDKKGTMTREFVEGFKDLEYLLKFFAAANAGDDAILTDKLDWFMRQKCDKLEAFLDKFDRDTLKTFDQTAYKLREAALVADPISAKELRKTADQLSQLSQIWGDVDNRLQLRELIKHVKNGDLEPKSWFQWGAKILLNVAITVGVCMAVSALCTPAVGLAIMPAVMAATREGTGYLNQKLGLDKDAGPIVTYMSGRTRYNPATQKFEEMSSSELVSTLGRNAMWDIGLGAGGIIAYKGGTAVMRALPVSSRFLLRLGIPTAAEGGAAAGTTTTVATRTAFERVKHAAKDLGRDFAQDCREGVTDDLLLKVVQKYVDGNPESYLALAPFMVRRGAKHELAKHTTGKAPLDSAPHEPQGKVPADPTKMNLSKAKPPDPPTLKDSPAAIESAKATEAAATSLSQRMLALDTRVRRKFVSGELLQVKDGKELEVALGKAEKLQAVLRLGVNPDYALDLTPDSAASLHSKLAGVTKVSERDAVVKQINALVALKNPQALDSYLALSPEKMTEVVRRAPGEVLGGTLTVAPKKR